MQIRTILKWIREILIDAVMFFAIVALAYVATNWKNLVDSLGI